jgi:hypothetical protein
MLGDRMGNALTTAVGAARDAYVEGCDRLMAVQPGAEAALRLAVAEDGGFLAARVALARVLQIEGRAGEGKAELEAARPLLEGATSRERGQFGIFATLLGGDGAGALSAIRAHMGEFPRDALALSPAAGVFGLIGFSGRAERERENLELLAPLERHLGDDWWFLGALAFAEIETGAIARGRAHVDRALALNPASANAAHVSAHGHYEAGDRADGVRFLGGWLEGYAPEAALHSHLNWHLALWAMQEGDLARAWGIYDAWLAPGVCRGPGINQVTDAASFLFRVGLAGAEVPGGRWAEVSEAAGRLFPAPGVSFIDLHAALAAAMAGDGGRLAGFAEGVRGFAGDLVGVAAQGFGAFARGDWAGVVDVLGPVLATHARFGGSRAQRDLLCQAVACGLMRLGRGEEAGRVLGRGVVG